MTRANPKLRDDPFRYWWRGPPRSAPLVDSDTARRLAISRVETLSYDGGNLYSRRSEEHLADLYWDRTWSDQPNLTADRSLKTELESESSRQDAPITNWR